MVKEVRFVNWKSFRDSILYIDPLTVLIGLNASGKSNALDGISFMNKLVQGIELSAALTGQSPLLINGSTGAIRGGVDWAARYPEKKFTIEVTVEYNDEIDYKYGVTVSTRERVELISESLVRVKYVGKSTKRSEETSLFSARTDDDESPVLNVDLYNAGRSKRKQVKRSVSVISQLRSQDLRQEIQIGLECVSSALESVFILDPVPSRMREYTPLANSLLTNASNLAGVLAALSANEKKKVENALADYLSKLPEGDIRRVWAEPVGRFNSDAMLYCEEKWSDSVNITVDARGMSDGTLRFLGIITALLTRSSRTLIVIEEVDNGLHPSRATLLLKMLKDIGVERQIDILMTTHNPALMDALGPEMTPFVVVAHRAPGSGESKLAMLEGIKTLPKLFAGGPLGKIVSEGEVEEALIEQEGQTNAR
ncbi:MAG: AAA family ATPase [Bacilli bacterium]